MGQPQIQSNLLTDISNLTNRVDSLERILASSIPHAEVSKSASQSISNGTYTALQFDTEVFDTIGMHDTVTNNSRLTAVTAGVYVLSATAMFVGAAGGAHRMIALRKNGLQTESREGGITGMTAFNAGSVVRMHVTTIWRLGLNDYVEAYAYQDSGGSLNTYNDVNEKQRLCAVWVSP